MLYKKSFDPRVYEVTNTVEKWSQMLMKISVETNSAARFTTEELDEFIQMLLNLVPAPPFLCMEGMDVFCFQSTRMRQVIGRIIAIRVEHQAKAPEMVNRLLNAPLTALVLKPESDVPDANIFAMAKFYL